MGSEENKKKKVTKYPPGGDVLFSDGDNANPESEQPSQGVGGTGWFFRSNKNMKEAGRRLWQQLVLRSSCKVNERLGFEF